MVYRRIFRLKKVFKPIPVNGRPVICPIRMNGQIIEIGGDMMGQTQINQPILRGSGIGSSEVEWWRRFRLRPSALVTLLGSVIWLVTILANHI